MHYILGNSKIVNRETYFFDEEDRIECIYFSFEITGYTYIFYVFYISPQLSRVILSPNFTSV